MGTNYKDLFAKQKQWTLALHKLCPTLTNDSGIYFWWRQEGNSTKMYIGKAKHLLDRSVSHCMGYSQRIDISIRKRGFYDPKDNPMGWHLSVHKAPESQLDTLERQYIEHYKAKADIELYNIESGGTTGKTIIGTRKPSKTYRDGLKQGELNARKFVAQLFANNLEFGIKGKPTVNKQKAYDKFAKFIEIKGDGE